MMQNSKTTPDKIPAQVSAAYTSGVLTAQDPKFANNVTGLVQSINYIAQKTAPNARIGWQFNLWADPTHSGGEKGLMHATEQMGQTAGKKYINDAAKNIAAYYKSAGITSYGASFISIDKYGLDGGSSSLSPTAASDPKNSTWFWNADLWNNYTDFVSQLHTSMGLPVELWQMPVGHINGTTMTNPNNPNGFANLDGSSAHGEDSAPAYIFGDTFNLSGNRLAYFGTNASKDPKVTSKGNTVTWGSHVQNLKNAGVEAIMFGAGVGDSTRGEPGDQGTVTDDNWWITAAQNYYKNS